MPSPARRPESQSRFRPALHELEARDVPATNVSLTDLQQFIDLTPRYKAGLEFVQSQKFGYAKPAPAPLKAAVTTI